MRKTVKPVILKEFIFLNAAEKIAPEEILTICKFGVDRSKLINDFKYCVQEGDWTNITYKCRSIEASEPNKAFHTNSEKLRENNEKKKRKFLSIEKMKDQIEKQSNSYNGKWMQPKPQIQITELTKEIAGTSLMQGNQTSFYYFTLYVLEAIDGRAEDMF